MTPFILNIHTATETAIVNLSHGPNTLHTRINIDTKKHAAFLHPAIIDILENEGMIMKDLSAVSVTSGPGSYTGMRVGIAAAKGFCYALKIPLITYNSLELLALSMIDFTKDSDSLYCPMIDARRMEVYTAVYDFNMREVEAPSAKILTEDSFQDYLHVSKMLFSGSGSKKFQPVTKQPGFCFHDIEISSLVLTSFSWAKYLKSEYANILSVQPLYIKQFWNQ